MNKINWGRVLLGGVVAGIVIDVFEYVLHTYVVADQEGAAMKTMGVHMISNAIPIFMAIGILIGIVTIWFYAAARPRYGGSAKTAALVGFGLWIISYAIPNVGLGGEGIFPMHLMGVESAIGLVEMIVATIVGAALYKE